MSARKKTVAADFTVRRNALVLAEARAAGLLGKAKDARISGRVSSPLLAAARVNAGVLSDTALIELALSKLALEDDFAEKLLALKGTVPSDLDLEF